MMSNNKYVFAMLGVFLVIGVLASTADAQTGSDIRDRAQDQLRDARQQLHVDRDKLREEAEERLQMERKRFEELRQRAKDTFESRREELRSHISEIRDEQKRKLADRISNQLDHINERWTTHFLNYLRHLENVLGKIALRADKAESNGSDVSQVRVSYDAAKNVIDDVRADVNEQAAKIYAVATSTTSTSTPEDIARSAFRAAMQQLRADLTALRDGGIRDAREAVGAALRALKAVPRVDDDGGSDVPATSTTSTATST